MHQRRPQLREVRPHSVEQLAAAFMKLHRGYQSVSDGRLLAHGTSTLLVIEGP